MGNIEFVGIINDVFNTELETKEGISIPENAHLIEEENWIDMFNPLNWLAIAIPIFAVILITMALKQRKNGIFNKEIKKEYMEENKITDKKKMIKVAIKRFFIVLITFWVAFLLVVPIHELIHCIAGAIFGLNMKFGIDPQTFIGFAYTEDPLTKTQFLAMSLAPLLILGIIPLIILFVKYPKGKIKFKRAFKYWFLTCFIGAIIISSAPDMLQSFNFIRNIPSDAIVENDYWYIPPKINY